MASVGQQRKGRAAKAEEIRRYFVDEARRKVQRRRAEHEFIRGLTQNSRLSHLDELEKRFVEESEKTAPVQEERPAKSEPEPPASAVTCVASFDTPARCIEVCHGGSTLWVGEADGSIGIRNGVTGKLAYIIERAGDAFVDTLHANDSQIWVGMSDGTIRIYDLLVYILAFECQGHTKSVTSFAPTFDEKMFSGSLDGSLVKWDNEANDFEVLQRITENIQPIRALACYGYNLFVSGDSGVIQCIDTETAAQVQVFEGHASKVNALLVSDGFLFSGGDDKKLIVWRIDLAQPVKVWEAHTAPITALHIDTVSHQLWASDASGAINIYDSTPRSSHDAKNFALIQTVMCDGGSRILSLKGIVAMDAVKIWSVGSNGMNMVWHSAKNKLELAVSACVDSMNSILEEDAIELAKWADLIRTMELVADRLVKSMTTTLAVSTSRATQRMALLRWMMWVHRQYLKKQHRRIATRMEAAAKRALHRQYYNKYLKFIAAQRKRRRSGAIATALYNDHNRNLLQLYFAKLKMSRAVVLARRRKNACMETLIRVSERRVSSRFFVNWKQFHDAQCRKKKRQRMAEALRHVSISTLLRSAYVRWRAHATRVKYMNRNAFAAGLLLDKTMNNSRAICWHSWQRFVSARRASKLRLKASEQLMKSTEISLGRDFYGRWRRFANATMTSRLEAQFDGRKGTVADLQAKLKGVEHLVRRRKLVDAAQGAIDAALSDRVKKQVRISELEEEIKNLQKSIEEKRSGATQRRERTVAQQLDDILSQLKCKVLNLHQDYGLIAVTQNRARNIGVVKCFLEAHMAVKRVVVEMTNPYLSMDAPWPLKDEDLQRMKRHHVETVLNAIKTMVITFDIMTAVDRSGISTDKEIIMNGKILMNLADVCVAARVAKLGGTAAAFRVKR